MALATLIFPAAIAEVAKSRVTAGPSLFGKEKAIGLVPKIGAAPP